MIERQPMGFYRVSCDRCGQQADADTDGDYAALKRLLRAWKWLIKQVDGDWKHYCPKCRGKVKA
jgi:hypothetical protein